MHLVSFAIDLAHVDKFYSRRVHALRDVSLQVRRGEVFGLLGPNGAGKSTLIKILMTVVRPTRCTGTLLDQPIGEKSTLARVGYLPENHRFPRYLTGRQVLDFFGALARVPRTQRRKRSAELIERVGMSAWCDRKVSLYSKGMMQRIGLAQALVNDPELILLDEPTDGVDPIGRKTIRDVIQRLRDEGKTIFINSHQLSELEAISQRVAIMVGGQVARQGTLDELSLARGHFRIEYDGELPSDFAEQFNRQANFEISSEPNALKIQTIDAAAAQPVIDALRARALVIRRLQLVRPTLEDLFIEAVGEQRQVGARL